MDYTVDLEVRKIEDKTPVQLDAGDIVVQAEYDSKLARVYFIILRAVKA